MQRPRSGLGALSGLPRGATWAWRPAWECVLTARTGIMHDSLYGSTLRRQCLPAPRVRKFRQQGLGRFALSIQAVAWAIEQQEVKDPGTQLVLVSLCNYADANGANAFPSIARMCRDTRMSESTVRRHLRKLELAALIVRGDQTTALRHIDRSDRRPVVYDIVLPRGVMVIPRKPVDKLSYGVSSETLRGVKQPSTGCQALTPNPERTVGDPKSAPSRAGATDSREDGESDGRKALRNLVRGLKGNLQ